MHLIESKKLLPSKWKWMQLTFTVIVFHMFSEKILMLNEFRTLIATVSSFRVVLLMKMLPNPLNACDEKLVEKFYGRSMCTNWKHLQRKEIEISKVLSYALCISVVKGKIFSNVKIVPSASSNHFCFSLFMLIFEFNSSFVILVVLLTCSAAFFPLSNFGYQPKDFHHKLTQFWVLFE